MDEHESRLLQQEKIKEPNNGSLAAADEIKSEDAIETSEVQVNGLEKETDGDTDQIPDISKNVEEEVSDTGVTKRFCIKCGEEIFPNQAFCAKCGQKVGDRPDAANTEKRHISKKWFIVGGIVILAVVVFFVVFLLVRGVQAKEITLNKDTLTIKAGEMEQLTYVIYPDNTKNKSVTWKSSNDSIARVVNNTIVAINEGDCVITISTKNGKTDTCSVVVTTPAPNLQEIYNECGDSLYTSLASDNSYITVDTNPFNIDDFSSDSAVNSIITINKALGLPESVLNKMSSTRALDGVQTYEGDGIEVRWTYHPNQSLLSFSHL